MTKTALTFAALVLAAGCFKEPAPAAKTVDPASRVYLKGASDRTFSAELLLREGRAFTEDKGYVPLSSLVGKIDPASIDYLNLDGCSFTNVDALASFTNLKWLRLNDNRLDALPDGLSNLKKLRRLYLRGNPLDEMPRAIEGMDSLASLDISETRISSIPEWFAGKRGLEHLQLSRTGITRLPGDLSAWKSLKSLQLGDIQGLEESEARRIRAALPDTAVVF